MTARAVAGGRTLEAADRLAEAEYVSDRLAEAIRSECDGVTDEEMSLPISRAVAAYDAYRHTDIRP